MAPLTMMDFTNQEWGLVMLTSCPRCQHTFHSPCCGPSCSCSSPSSYPRTGSTATDRLSSAGFQASPFRLSGGGCCLGPRSPELYPSLPISFVLPCPPINPKPHVPLALHNASDLDLQRLSVALKRLKATGWYYEGLTWQESITLLAPTKTGTFLVRDSSNPSYLFSMSVQAEQGPTSVRIHYSKGYFRLDADPSILTAVPLFDCVVKMIEYYIYAYREPNTNSDMVFLDGSGSKYSSILLRQPLLRVAPSLQHLARLKVNSLHRIGDPLPSSSLPGTLREYLAEYPYTH